MMAKKELKVPIKPKVPVFFFLNDAPIDSQLSSSKVIFLPEIILFIKSKSFEFPNKFTARIAFVFFVMLFLIFQDQCLKYFYHIYKLKF